MKSTLWQIFYNGRRAVLKYVFNEHDEYGETMVIMNLLKRYNCPQTYVEVGAHDGLSASMTYGLLQNGWSGWSLEPNPFVHAKLVKNLSGFPRSKQYNYAIAPIEGPIKLYLAENDPDGYCSSISSEGGMHDGKSIDVKGIRLADFLERENVPARIGLIMIDTEDMDLEVLQTLDMKRHRPCLIVTEDSVEKNEMKHSLLASHGFIMLGRIAVNTFWLDRHLGSS